MPWHKPRQSVSLYHTDVRYNLPQIDYIILTSVLAIDVFFILFFKKGWYKMGQLRTRKRGKTWEWSFEGAKIDGKRNPISKGGYRTKAEAQEAGIQAKAEYDNTGRSFKPSAVSYTHLDVYKRQVFINMGLHAFHFFSFFHQ